MLEFLEFGVEVQWLTGTSEEGVGLGGGEESVGSGSVWAVGRWWRLRLQGVLGGQSVDWFWSDVHRNGLGGRVVDGIGSSADNLNSWPLGNGLWLLVSEWTGSWAGTLTDLDLLFGLFLVVSGVVVVLEDGGRWPRSGWCLGRAWTRSNWSSGVVLWDVLVGFFLGFFFFFFAAFWVVGVTWVSRHVGELTFVTVWVDITVLASDDAISSAGFFLERTIGSFVTEGE